MKAFAINKISTLFILALFTVQLSAQYNKLSVWGGGGVPGIKYSNFNGTQENSPVIAAGIDFKYYFTERISVSIGGEYNQYKSTAKLDQINLKSNEIDSRNDQFEFRISAEGYNEIHTLTAINIPLKFNYDYPLSTNVNLFGGIGFKFSVPIKTNFETSFTQLKTTGYYPDLNVEFEDMPDHGFGTLNDYKGSQQKLNINPTIFATAEIGVNFWVTPIVAIFAAGFVDYGINKSINKLDKEPLVQYQYEEVSIKNGKNMFKTGAIEGLQLMTFGTKIGISIAF